MDVVCTIESMIIVSPIIAFELKLVPIFSSWIPLKKLEIIFKVRALLLLFSSLLV